jgi:hypothetical protein
VDDLIFYEVAIGMRENTTYLITFNIKHYSAKDFIITPAEMIHILTEDEYTEEA